MEEDLGLENTAQKEKLALKIKRWAWEGEGERSSMKANGKKNGWKSMFR